MRLGAEQKKDKNDIVQFMFGKIQYDSEGGRGTGGCGVCPVQPKQSRRGMNWCSGAVVVCCFACAAMPHVAWCACCVTVGADHKQPACAGVTPRLLVPYLFVNEWSNGMECNQIDYKRREVESPFP